MTSTPVNIEKLEHLFSFDMFQYDSNVTQAYPQNTPELESIVENTANYLSYALSNVMYNPDWKNTDRCERDRCGKIFEYKGQKFQVVVYHKQSESFQNMSSDLLPSVITDISSLSLSSLR